MPQNYLKYSIISFLFIIPFVGLLVSSNLFFPYITGKNLAFRALVEIAFALYLILALRVPVYRPKLSTILLSFSAFLTVILFADIFGEYPFKSFWSNFERMEGFVTHAHLFAYFIMLAALFTGEKIWTRFFQTSLGVSVIMGFIGTGQIMEEGGRISAQLGNSTYLGIYTLFHIFIAGFLLVRVIERKGDVATKWMKGLVYAFIILFNFYIFYNTGTRSALLGLAAGAFFTSIAFAIWEKHKGLKILGITVLAIIILSVGSLAVFKESAFIKDSDLLSRFSQLATFDKAGLEQFATTQGKGRFGIWNIAYEGFKERPILGWGQDNFNYVFNKYYDPKIYDQEQWFDRAHNVFFDWLIAGGILGLLAYLSLFAAAIVAIWRSRAHEKDLYFLFSDKVLLTALLIAYFIHNLFVFDSLTSYILFFGVLAFISIHDRKTIAWPALSKPIKDQSYLMAGSTLAVIGGAIALYYFTIAPYLAGSTLIKALSLQSFASRQNSEQGYQAALESYDKALSYDNVVGITEGREQLLQGASSVVMSPGVSDAVKNAYVTKVRDEMKKQLETVPPDARYYLFYGSFLSRLGLAASSSELVNEGITHLTKAVELSPKKQTILFETGATYINTKQYALAVPYFKKAFESEPGYNDARFLYAIALIYAGDIKGSDEVLKPLDGTAYGGDYRLLRAYYEKKLAAKLGAALRYKLTYADKLAAAGDKEGAIAQIAETMELSPSFRAEGERRIAELQKTP
jgi:O-antigen ligase/Flp pilus assembly protein TadD